MRYNSFNIFKHINTLNPHNVCFKSRKTDETSRRKEDLPNDTVEFSKSALNKEKQEIASILSQTLRGKIEFDSKEFQNLLNIATLDSALGLKLLFEEMNSKTLNSTLPEHYAEILNFITSKNYKLMEKCISNTLLENDADIKEAISKAHKIADNISFNETEDTLDSLNDIWDFNRNNPLFATDDIDYITRKITKEKTDDFKSICSYIINNNKKDMYSYGICALSELNETELTKAQKYIKDYEIDGMQASVLAKLDSKKIKELNSIPIVKEYGLLRLNYDIVKSISDIIDLVGIDNFQKKVEETEAKYGDGFHEYDLYKFIRYNCTHKQDYNSIVEEAFSKRNQLEAEGEFLTDDEIYNFFYHAPQEKMATIDLLSKGTFLYAFSKKIDGLKDLAEDCSNLKINTNDKLYEKIVEIFNPEKSKKYEQLMHKKELLEKEAKEVAQFYKPKFEELRLKQNTMTKTQYQEALKKLSDEQKRDMPPIKETKKEIQDMLNKAKKLNHKQKLQRIEVLSDLAKNLKDMSKFIDILASDDYTWNSAVNKQIYKQMGIPFDENLSQRLKFDKSGYASEIVVSCIDFDFTNSLGQIVELINANPDKQIDEILNGLVQNVETKEIFENLGLNYDKWVNVDKDSFVKTTVKLDEQKAKAAAIENLEADFNDPMFEILPEEYKKSITKELEKNNICLKNTKEPVYDEDGFLTGEKNQLRLFKDGKPIGFKDLGNIINAVKNEINTNNLWNKPHCDQKINEAIKTMKEHIIKLRYNDFKSASNIKGNEETEIEVHKVDMNNISHSLFLGNHSSCCTAVGGGINDWSAPNYIKNKCIQAIEIVDNNEPIGNTMCYIAKVDGELALVLDNIELKTKYQNNDVIKEAIFDYARMLAKETGKENLPIYLGTHRHKIDTNGLEKATHQICIMGSTNNEKVYIDYLTEGRVISDDITDNNIILYKVPDN